MSSFQGLHFLCIGQPGQQHSKEKHVKLENPDLTYSQVEAESATVLSPAHVPRLLGEGDGLVFANIESARVKGAELRVVPVLVNSASSRVFSARSFWCLFSSSWNSRDRVLML